MLRRFFEGRAVQAPIDAQIEAVLYEMSDDGVTSDEYATYLSYLERLNKLKRQDKPQRVSRETVFMGAVQILGILVIVMYEQKHVLTSKGLNRIPRFGKS